MMEDFSVNPPAVTLICCCLMALRSVSAMMWSVCFWIAATGIHCQLASVTMMWGQTDTRSMNAFPLPDVGLDTLPNLQQHRWIVEVLHAIPVLYLAWYAWKCRSARALRLFLWSHGVVLLLRAASFSGTILPDPSRMCRDSGYIGSCHDLVFSGHACLTTLAVCILFALFPLRAWEKLLLAVDWFVTCVVIVACQNHYTVDVVVAVYTTALVAWVVVSNSRERGDMPISGACGCPPFRQTNTF